MNKLLKPTDVFLDLEKGIILNLKPLVRKLSDLKVFFFETSVVENMLASGLNPIIYEVYECLQPENEGELNFGTTILYPGKVGGEYYFTKGHYHLRHDASEVYLGLKGDGIILLQSKTGDVKVESLKARKVVYVPSGWGHRTINVGDETLIFFFVYPSNAGHDYEAVEKQGFSKIVLEQNGKSKIVDNPKFANKG